MKHICARFLECLDIDSGPGPDSEVAGKIRAEQIRAIADTAPVMLSANMICAFVIFFTFYNVTANWFLAPWIICISALAVVGLFHSHRKKSVRKAKPHEVKSFATKRVQIKAVKASATMATLWAMLPIVLYPSVAVPQQVTVISAMAGVLGAGALSFYMIPMAMFSWLFVIAIGSTIALFLEGSTTSFGAVLLLWVYSFALFKAGKTISKIFIQAQIAKLEVIQQADTIGLLLKEFSENVSDWLWEFSPSGTIVRGRKEFEESLNVPVDSLVRDDVECIKNTTENSSINYRSLEALRHSFQNKKSFRDIVVQSNVADGNYWVSLSGKPIFNTAGEFVGFRGFASDVTERKMREDRIAFLAHNDALTGLVNRETFSTELKRKFVECNKSVECNKNAAWSVLYLDLDGFKSINDNQGHRAGDQLLSAVASRLKGLVSDKDVVARLGGDEFAILSNTADTVQSVSSLAEVLVAELAKPYVCDGRNLAVGVSIGIAMGPKDGQSASSILHSADLALYRAKAEGKGTFRLFEVGMDEVARERRILESDLRQALQNNELTIRYQPVVSAMDEQLAGFEALVRWHHPSRGIVSPSDFIPVAERLGIIAEIGEWVLRQACISAAGWPETLNVAVNLSPQQFNSKQIVSIVIDALNESGLAPSRLELEITEGLFMENTDDILYALRELKSMGVQIAMDDFGTGYSSLSYIMKFPFDKLKIDRSFILSVDEDKVTRNVLEVITNLGEALDLKVTAEGIETQQQLEVLKNVRCTHYQGYYFGKPMPENELPIYILSKLVNAFNFSSKTKANIPAKRIDNIATG